MKKIAKIYDIEVEYEVIHRKVKHARLEIKTDKLRLIMPLNYDEDEYLIKTHEKWIYNKICRIRESMVKANEKALDFKKTEEEFRAMILSLVERLSEILGVTVNRVYFKHMKTRWGSCSSKKNVNINLYLMYLPNYLIEYVVFHEVTHIIEMSHKKPFWDIISSRYPDYKKMEDELLMYWILVREIIPS